jgi:pimeloyl-[acyl-carrier protein] synthase
MKDRKNTPREDLATRLIHARDKDSRITEEQIVDNAMLICADAIGNVHNGLTNAVLTLLSNEAQRKQLRDGPGLIAAAVDECLRFESPAQYQGRIAGEDIEIRGQKIRKNSVVLLALGSANRDPDVFEEPDTFNILRPKTTHLAFGLGPHRCIGIGLVRTAFECALRQLFQGAIELKLMEQEIDWISRAGHRWPQALNLRVGRYLPG